MFSRIYENFIEKFYYKIRGKILNIHPSLLPKYKGLSTHKKLLKTEKNFLDVPCILSLQNYPGKIILQKRVKVRKNDTEETLAKRILIQEHKIYPLAIKNFSINL